jgi:3D (Asp-Asp-Asp) domain-containing protein
MSKIKSVPGAVWLLIGVLVTLLVIPSTAYAAALKFTGIEGTSTNKADVTPAGQLQVAAADPSAFFQSSTVPVLSTTFEPFASAPSPYALIATVIHVDIYTGESGSAEDVEMNVQEGTSCAGTQVGTYSQIFNPAGNGMTDINLDPGLVVPAGDALCGRIGGSVGAELVVSGYTVPATAVAAEPTKAVSAASSQAP